MRLSLRLLVCATILFAFTNYATAQREYISTIAGTGTAGWSGDGGPATAAEIYGSNAMCIDITGNVFFVDAKNNRVRMIDTFGIIREIAGNGIAGYSGDGGPATAAELNDPAGVAIDGAGNLYVEEYYNNVIRKVKPAINGIITTIAGTGTPGYYGDGGPATAAMFYHPNTISFDSYGNLYTADEFNQVIRKIAAHTDTIALTDTITTFAGVASVSGYGGDNMPAVSALLNYPCAVYADAHNNIFISDNGNQRMRKVNTHDTITTVAGNGSAGYSGDGGPATNAMINFPASMAVDDSGNFIFCDASNNRVRKVNTLGVISTIAGTGVAGMGADGVPATSSALNLPLNIAIDHEGDILLADNGNNRIQIIESTCRLPSLSPITGARSGCLEERITLSNSASGGIWSSGTTAVAIVGSVSGIVTCVGAGIATITYTAGNSCGTSFVTDTVTVNPYAGVITGLDSVCRGDSIMLSDWVPSGVWRSSNNSIATITVAGSVHGITDGLDTIMYVVNDTCGADTAFFPIEIGACGLGVNAIGNLSTSSLNIYPNPSHSSFIVSLLSSTAQTAQIVIFNMLGEKVKEYSISANKETELHIDVPGVYFISVFAGSENINKKIIVE